MSEKSVTSKRRILAINTGRRVGKTLLYKRLIKIRQIIEDFDITILDTDTLSIKEQIIMGRNYTTEEYYKMLARNLGGEGLTLILEQDAIGQTFEIENLPTSPAGVEFDPADFVRWLKTSLADITCAACGRPFKTKSGRDNHIKNYHDMTIKEYNAQFNEYGEPRSGQ